MSLALRTSLGCAEVIIADDGNLQFFYQVANLLEDDFQIKFLNKEDEFDSISWDFRYKGYQLTLHYNIYSGILLFPTKTREAGYKENKSVMELAELIEEKMQQTLLRNIA